MKTRLIETDEFETDSQQEFETKECMNTPDLFDIIDWEHSGELCSIDLRFQPQSKKSMLTIKPTLVIRMIIVSVHLNFPHVGLSCPVVARRAKQGLSWCSFSEDGS